MKAGQYKLAVEVTSTLEWQDVSMRAPPETNDSALDDAFDDDAFSDPFSSRGGGDPFQQMRQRMQRMMQQLATEANITHVTTDLLESSQFAHHPFDHALAEALIRRYVDMLDPTHSLSSSVTRRHSAKAPFKTSFRSRA